MFFEDATEAAYMAKCFVGQPVGELEDLVRHAKDNLEFPFDPKTESRLMQGMDVPFRPTRLLSRAALSGILDAVRNMVLDLCLKLEKDGVLGEGLVFSAKEKEAAAHSGYTINYNAPVSHSQIQQGSPYASQTMTVSESDKPAIADFLRALKEHTPELHLDASATEKISVEVRTLETQVASESPSRKVVQQSLHTVRNVLEGCVGSIIASGLLFEISRLLK